MENNGSNSSKKLKIELPYDPAIPFLGIYPKEMKTEIYISMHGSIIHKNQDMFSDRWMDKENVTLSLSLSLCVYIYIDNGILLIL